MNSIKGINKSHLLIELYNNAKIPHSLAFNPPQQTMTLEQAEECIAKNPSLTFNELMGKNLGGVDISGNSIKANNYHGVETIEALIKALHAKTQDYLTHNLMNDNGFMK